jgi:hypothetical protein
MPLPLPRTVLRSAVPLARGPYLSFPIICWLPHAANLACFSHYQEFIPFIWRFFFRWILSVWVAFEWKDTFSPCIIKHFELVCPRLVPGRTM